MNIIELIATLKETLEGIEKSEKFARRTLIAKDGGDLNGILEDIEYSCCMARQDLGSLRLHLQRILGDTQ